MNVRWERLIPQFISRRIKNRPMLRKVISNTAWLAADKILRLGVSLFVTAWVARYLGPEQYGLLSYAAALIALLGAIGGLGLEGILVREFVRDPNSAPTLLGTALVLRLVGGTAVFLIAFALAIVIRPNNHGLAALVAIIALGNILQAFDVLDQWFQSKLLSKRTVVAKNTAFLIMAVIKVVLILYQAPLLAFAAAATGEITIGAAALLVAYKGTGERIKTLKFELPMAHKLLKESWPLIISGMAVGIYMRIDQIMLGQMMGDKAVGIYTAATKLTEFSYIIPTMIMASASPALFSLRNTNEVIFIQRLEQLFRLLVGLALAMAISMTLFSGVIVRLLYGNSYAESGMVLAVHVWAAVFVYLGVAQHPWYLSVGLIKLAAIRTVAGALVNIGLNLLLIPRYGPVGAATATLLSYGFADMLFNAVNARTREIFLMQVRAFQLWKLPR